MAHRRSGAYLARLLTEDNVDVPASFLGVMFVPKVAF
jgi:hypothetical protein